MSISDMYKTDLERHLFALPPRSERQHRLRPRFEALSAQLQLAAYDTLEPHRPGSGPV